MVGLFSVLILNKVKNISFFPVYSLKSALCVSFSLVPSVSLVPLRFFSRCPPCLFVVRVLAPVGGRRRGKERVFIWVIYKWVIIFALNFSCLARTAWLYSANFASSRMIGRTEPFLLLFCLVSRIGCRLFCLIDRILLSLTAGCLARCLVGKMRLVIAIIYLAR